MKFIRELPRKPARRNTKEKNFPGERSISRDLSREASDCTSSRHIFKPDSQTDNHLCNSLPRQSAHFSTDRQIVKAALHNVRESRKEILLLPFVSRCAISMHRSCKPVICNTPSHWNCRCHGYKLACLHRLDPNFASERFARIRHLQRPPPGDNRISL